MAKDTKFGTLGGVFTPSLLTILGVIMYLRLPWVMGHAGLTLGVGIILVAHVISVTTGLSISSIATDKRVGAGGPYYIISRSLGLPIGGTLGLALFLGFSISISFYVIGFSESFLTYLGIGLTPEGLPATNALRICGSVTILALTIVTFISTELAIKAQYLILAAIGLSLGSIFLGHPSSLPATVTSAASSPAPSAGVLFGIFFPAVTGFTAGVNMSGDLRDPNRSLPWGTLAAIGTGLLVYLALGIYMLAYVPREQLINNPLVLFDLSLWAPLVVAGVWGATLSSALGSILGAPRILQALSVDRIAPGFLARTHGRSREPRNALYVAFAIGEAGVLIAQLDALAGVVSMTFLATYGFLNLSCAIESWASADFRPVFRIPKTVSIIGVITCVVIMIEIDLTAMLGASALLTGLFFYLKRRQLTLDSGDTWEGIWSSLIRAGLQRLGQTEVHPRNWRPNALVFAEPAVGDQQALFSLADDIVRGRGLKTSFALAPSVEQATAPQELEVDRAVSTADPFGTIAAVCQFHGYPHLAPNLAMLDWRSCTRAPDRFLTLLGALDSRELNILLLSPGRTPFGAHRTIDVWWTPGQGNLPLSIAVLRFLTTSDTWQRATIRFLLVAGPAVQAEGVPAATRALLAQARLGATMTLLREGANHESFADAVRHESAGADLVLLGLPSDLAPGKPDSFAGVARLVDALGTVVLVRASPLFEDVFAGKAATTPSTPPSSRPSAARELPLLRLPAAGNLAHEVTSFDERLRGLMRSFSTRGLAESAKYELRLLDSLEALWNTQLGQLEKVFAATTASPRRLRSIGRAERTILQQAQKLVGEFVLDDFPTQRAILDGRVDEFIDGCAAMAPVFSATLLVRRGLDELRLAEGDTRYLARFKRWARLRARLGGGGILQRLPLARVVDIHVALATQRLADDGMAEWRSTTEAFGTGLVDLLESLLASLASLRRQPNGEPIVREALSERRRQLAAEIARLRELLGEQLQARIGDGERRAREVAQQLADELSRLDVERRLRAQEKHDTSAREAQAALRRAPDAWQRQKRLLLQQVELTLTVEAFRHRVRWIVNRMMAGVLPRLARGLPEQLAQVHASVQAYVESLDAGERKEMPVPAGLAESVDVHKLLDDLAEDADQAVAELPETVIAMARDTRAGTEQGALEEKAGVELPLRRLAQFLLESALLGGLQAAFAQLPMAERRAISVAEEVGRLLSFQASELDSDEDLDEEVRREQLRSAARDGLERMTAERDALRLADEKLVNAVEEQLQAFLKATEARVLMASTEKFGHRARKHERRKTFSRLRTWQSDARQAAERLAVRLFYRGSSGVLAARKLRDSRDSAQAVVGRTLGRVTQLSPTTEVLEALPFYYQQLFLGHAATNEAFWVGRDRQLAAAEQAVRRRGTGVCGALLVTGDPGSGKTALCGAIGNRFFDPAVVYRLQAPLGGSVEPAGFCASLSRATRLHGELDDIMQALPEGSVVIVDDLELWWERTERGFEMVMRIRELIDRYADRCTFLVSCNTQAFRLIDRFAHYSDRALAVLDCEPVDAEALMSMVMLRHRSAGKRLVLDGRDEARLPPWRVARLFNDFFTYSAGNPAAALHGWIASVERVEDDTLFLRRAPKPVLPSLQDLRVELVVLLLELLLHKQVSWSSLERVTHVSGPELRSDVDALLRMQLITAVRTGVLEPNRYVRHLVVDELRQRGFLS